MATLINPSPNKCETHLPSGNLELAILHGTLFGTVVLLLTIADVGWKKQRS